jgi:hypothetical protein
LNDVGLKVQIFSCIIVLLLTVINDYTPNS